MLNGHNGAQNGHIIISQTTIYFEDLGDFIKNQLRSLVPPKSNSFHT